MSAMNSDPIANKPKTERRDELRRVLKREAPTTFNMMTDVMYTRNEGWKIEIGVKRKEAKLFYQMTLFPFVVLSVDIIEIGKYKH